MKSGAFEILRATATEGFRERYFQDIRRDLLGELVEYRKDYGRSGLKIHVFTSRPHVQKYNRNSMFFFINGGWCGTGSFCMPSARLPEHPAVGNVSGDDTVRHDSFRGCRRECASGEDRGPLQAPIFIHDAIRDSILPA